MTTRTKHGLAALDAMFARTAAEGRAAFLPYFPVGYPSMEESVEIFTAMAAAGADGFEVGIPFSDPLADGPTIQAATQIALDNGTTTASALELVRTLRERGIDQPVLMFSYLNPLLAYGAEQFVVDARAAGADGLIVPDLPPEEAHHFAGACEREGLALVFFLAPTSDTQRIQLVAQQATGFIYVVSLTGTTGARADLPADLTAFIDRVRQQTDVPLVLGFGISTPDHARMMNGLVNGFIVGSALVRAAQHGLAPVRDLVAGLRITLDAG